VGCGVGTFLADLADVVGTRGRVVGLDRSSEFAATARSRMADTGREAAVEILEADAHHLPFADGSFDAAHCERLLMHVEDPDRVLREMRRVVRPGGRIVAAEPHWDGAELDHPDAEAIELLIERWLTGIRHPRMGLELNRRFAEAGLVEREVVPVFAVPTDAARLVRYGLDLRGCADELVADRVLTMERARAALDVLVPLDHEAGFCGYIAVFIVAGRVPERSTTPLEQHPAGTGGNHALVRAQTQENSGPWR
jgi:SAM-dependent methyltransferase